MFSSSLIRGILLLLVLMLLLSATPPANANTTALSERPTLLAMRMSDIVTNRARLVQASFIFVGIGVLLMCYKHK